MLHNVSATIDPHEVIGVIGPSGSGKSTLVQLLLGLREPTSGLVLAGDRDIRVLSRTEWARKVTFVPQDAHLIAGTIADNIRFLRDDISQERHRTRRPAWPISTTTSLRSPRGTSARSANGAAT